jgi:hypothetical protein
MKGREDVIDSHRTRRLGRNLFPGNGAKGCPRGQWARATFLARKGYFKGLSAH